MRVASKHFALAALYLALIAGTAAMAAQISSQPHDGYKRVLFRFDQEARLTIGGGGTSVNLQFTEPLGLSPDAVTAQLSGYAKSASLSPDGKTLTLSLVKPFRTRQFRSGNTLGLDLIGDADSSAAAPVAEAAPEKPAEKPKAPPEKKVETARVEKPKTSPFKPAETTTKPDKKLAAEARKSAPFPAVEEAILTTKSTPAPTPAASTPAAAAPAAEPLLTTKSPEPLKQEPVAEKAPEPAPVATPQPAEAPPPATEKTSPAPAPAKEEPKPTPPETSNPFIVTAKTVNEGTIINFPWSARTAAAVFERARDIWIVFSRPQDANVNLLRTVMPKGVADVTQFAYPGATVLRITTDGSLHASTEQPKGSYAWNITLGTTGKPASLDVPVTGESTDGDRHLLVAAFDTSPILRFYDPRIGDLVLVVPTYESGRGVSFSKSFPELSVLASGQGVAIAANRDDIKTSRNRAGIIVSAPGGLAVSENLSTLGQNAKPVPGVSAVSDVMMPYDQWYVPPEQFYDVLTDRLSAAASAAPAARPDALMKIVGQYLGQGLAPEAAGYLRMIRLQYPDYYTSHRLALLDAAAAVLQNDLATAQRFLAEPELHDMPEAQLWHEVVDLYAPPLNTVQQMQQSVEHPNGPPAPVPAPTPKTDDDQEPASKGDIPPPPTVPTVKSPFRFLKWNKPYIHFYPPKIRQKLAILASDAYLTSGQEEKALQAYETLNRDGILGPIQRHAEEAVVEVAELRNQTQQALQGYDRLAAQVDDPYIRVRAAYRGAMLRYKRGMIKADETAEILERIRLAWRGDKLGHDILTSLADIYRDAKQYDNTLRTWRILLEEFPGDPDFLKISGAMGDLFQNLFLHGLADDMPPLKSLALFYEFRDLTPVGPNGDAMIQKLADRLAAFDLLDRASQLLEHQIRFRVTGAERSKVGARLSLLYLFNHQPKEALDVLQITNYGENAFDLQMRRQQLTADALSKLGKNEDALGMISSDSSREGALLRLDILWAMQDWPNVVNQAEDLLTARNSLTAKLKPEETDVLLKLALGYAFQGDVNQLRYLHDYYGNLIPDSGYKEIFNYITNDTTPLDAADIDLLTSQVNHTESFLNTFKEKIAAGKLSEAVK